MQRFMGYFLTGSFESSENRLLSRAALNEGCLFRGSLVDSSTGICVILVTDRENTGNT